MAECTTAFEDFFDTTDPQIRTVHDLLLIQISAVTAFLTALHSRWLPRRAMFQILPASHMGTWLKTLLIC